MTTQTLVIVTLLCLGLPLLISATVAVLAYRCVKLTIDETDEMMGMSE